MGVFFRQNHLYSFVTVHVGLMVSLMWHKNHKKSISEEKLLQSLEGLAHLSRLVVLAGLNH